MKKFIPILLLLLSFNSFAAASLDPIAQNKDCVVAKFNHENSHGITATHHTSLKTPSESSPSYLLVFLQTKLLAEKNLCYLSQIQLNLTPLKTYSFPFLPYSQASPLS